MVRLFWLSLSALGIACPFVCATTFAQEKAAALQGDDLKDAKKAISSKDWFPEETRDPIKLTQGALSLSNIAKESKDDSEAYAALAEAIKLSDTAGEWHLSRDIIREMDSRFDLPPEAIKKWYQNAIRKCDLGARLAELVDVFADDVLHQTLAESTEDWQPLHRLLTSRLNERENLATLFACRDRMTQCKNRLDLLQKEQTPLWKGITAIVQLQDIDTGIQNLSESTKKTISAAAKAWDKEEFSFDTTEELLISLIELDDANAREAAISIFQSIISELTYNQILRLQDICYSLTHKLRDDFSLPYYDHRHDPGQEVRLDVIKLDERQRNVRFIKDEKSWEVKDECWFNYAQMPVTNTVHDIEFTAQKIPSFFKFRYGAYNSLRVGFEQVENDRFRLKHERSYGGSKRFKRSKDTFAYGDRIKMTIFTMCGRQFVIINQKYASERTLDNVWTSHQFVCEGGTKLKLHKSTLRNWLAGDRERMLRTFGDHSSLRCTRDFAIDWNRDELTRYTKERDAHSRTATTPVETAFVTETGVTMLPVAAGKYKHGEMAIKLTKPFWISQHEITQLQWEELMRNNPASIQGNAHFPVDNLSYQEAVTFCKRLTNREKQKRTLPKGFVYRLPTEAEWAYVCRAGTTEPFSVKEDQFWYRGSAEARYHAVGTSSPNPFGVYDMHGNVEEFTLDQYVGVPGDAKGVQIDPVTPPDEKDDHVSIRGGSWCMLKADCQSDKRKGGLMERCPYRGFRVVLAPVKK